MFKSILQGGQPMRALVLESPDHLRYKDIPVPVCGDDQLLIKIKTSCICNGSDPSILSGATWSDFPAVFGHEAFGEVAEVGRNVTGYAVGDYISWWFTMNAFTEYAVIAPDKVAVIRLPKDICRLEAPIFELAVAAYRAVSVADVEGKKVLIVGLGPSGLIMAQLCGALGAELVSGWDLYDNRNELGKVFGCGEHDGQYDVVIDAFGDDLSEDGKTIDRAIERLRDFGTLVLYGHPVHGRTMDSFLLQKKQIAVKMPVNDIKEIQKLADHSVRFYAEGKLRLKELVTKTAAFDEIAGAMDLLQKEPGKYIKIIILNEEG
jgi:2-desacetyl-2-hydroxyethyl bacteriochlorophyllide A dehydrogenase